MTEERYRSKRDYMQAMLRAADKAQDTSQLNPITIMWAAVGQQLQRIADAIEHQTTIAERTLVVLEQTHLENERLKFEQDNR